MGVVDGDGLAHGIGIAEILLYHLLGDNQRARPAEGNCRITLDQGKGEHLENPRVDGANTAFEEGVLPVTDEQSAREGHPGCLLDFWDLGLQNRAHGIRRDVDVKFALAALLVLFDPIEGSGVCVEPVEAQFILNPEEDEEGAGHPNRQPGYVDEGIAFMLPEISQGYHQIIFEHGEILKGTFATF